MNTASGVPCPAKASGPSRDPEAVGDSVPDGVTGQAFCPHRMGFEGDRAAVGIGSQPFDGDAAGPPPTSHSNWVPPGRNAHGQRAHRFLGELAVVLVLVVGQARGGRPAWSAAVDGNNIERIHVGDVAVGADDSFGGSAEAFQDPHLRVTESVVPQYGQYLLTVCARRG